MKNKETDIKKLIKDADIDKKENWGGELMYWVLYMEYLDKEYSDLYMSKYTLEFNTILNILSYRKIIPTFSLFSKKITSKDTSANFYKEFSENKDKRFVIFPLILTGSISHQNALLLDTKKMEAELFEPYGDLNITFKRVVGENANNIVDKQKLYESIRELLNIFSPNKKIKLFLPENFLPPKSLQEIEETECIKDVYKVNTSIGFCVAWTMFYLENRIKNPNKNRNDTIKYIMGQVKKGKSDKYICELIRKYSVFILNLYKSKSFKERLYINTLFKWKLYLLQTASVSLFTYSYYNLLKKLL
jgi:hypothetical protein